MLVLLLRQCDEVMFRTNDKEIFVTTEEFGHDLKQVEVLQWKFYEFQKKMASQAWSVIRPPSSGLHQAHSEAAIQQNEDLCSSVSSSQNLWGSQARGGSSCC